MPQVVAITAATPGTLVIDDQGHRTVVHVWALLDSGEVLPMCDAQTGSAALTLFDSDRAFAAYHPG